MEAKKTSLFENGLLWFGAGLSIAEILTGTYFADLGIKKGILAIVTGHLIGCILLYLAGLIGAKTEKSAMETVKISFGEVGGKMFSGLNILQLLGWTAVMTYSGASACSDLFFHNKTYLWCLLIGGFIALWIMVGPQSMKWLNVVAMGGLFVLTIVLSVVVFKGNPNVTQTAGMSFGQGVELAVAMPLSWLPLISDYTKNAEKGKKATAVSCIVYFGVSVWMYVIGLGAAVFTGKTDVAEIMQRANLGMAALLIVIFSTVTTTFLDAYSAGVSSKSVIFKCREKRAALFCCLIGTVLAIFTPITKFQDFLYFIGSVFAPMIAVLICDFYILKRDASDKKIQLQNMILWGIGFLVYRLLMKLDTPLGNTIGDMLFTMALCLGMAKTESYIKKWKIKWKEVKER